ncbi:MULTISPECIES: sensor histidine kinase [unclassified Rhizobium]|uniref:sensor histidine kinase n=1 Tax=unclassified Rhizobium TaxID=2613769 RepID=UPI000712C65C|nr:MULTISPECIES: HAMP domain-containing sensor histidine kinase [unclassified Rhizobium]KQU05989.1 hypothetical protein ASG68_24880 [Rhizobium sp. Leaf453]
MTLTDAALQPTLDRVVEEMRSVWADRTNDADFKVSYPMRMHHPRLAQMFSNLLGNALTHGSPDTPVKIVAETTDEAFELWIANAGDPIPEDAPERLFQRFTRPVSQRSKEGLGLGLYIAA